MPERRKLHPNPEVNLRKFARAERNVEDAGYVVKDRDGSFKEYFDSYKEARARHAELVKTRYLPEELVVINVSRQAIAHGTRNMRDNGRRSQNSNAKAKKTLFSKNMDSRFMGNGFSGHELALMTMGRMCEATSHVFRCAYPTPEMRKMAQRALMHQVRNGRAVKDELIEKALKLKLPEGIKK